MNCGYTKVSDPENQCQTVSAADPDLNSIKAENKTACEKRAEMRLNRYVCFLLKCFEKLHYCILKECIFYEEEGLKYILKLYSKVKQYKLFKNIPDVCMDEFGILSLKNKFADINFAKKRQMTLLSICILAFKKEMHFKDLIKEAIEKSKLSVVYFQSMSAEHQLEFFKKLSPKFIVSDDGFVKLLPVFIFPTCSLKDLYIASTNTKIVACTEVQNISYKKEKVRLRAERKLNKCVSFVLKCFGSLHYSELKACICYADGCYKKFLEQFSEMKQREYFENIPNTAIDQHGFLSLRNKNATASIAKTKLANLLFVCLLAFKKEMHVKDLINEAIERSEQFADYFADKSSDDHLQFLKKLPSKFAVSDDGFVKLLPVFTLPKCSVEDISTSCKDTKVVDCTKVQSNKNYTTSNTNSGNQTALNKHNNEERVIHSIEMEYVIYLLKFFKSLHYCTLRECIFYAEESCSNFLEHSSLFEQRQYFEQLPYTAMDESGILCLRGDLISTKLSKKQKRIIIIICILALKKEMRIKNLFIEAFKNSRLKYFKNISVEDQHKFLEDFPSIFSVSKGGVVNLLPKLSLLKYSSRDSSATIDEYVIYLLKFFKSLHYCTLRECISYAEESFSNYLEHSSLFEQRQYFEQIPNTAKDKNGFLCLKSDHISAKLSKKQKRKIIIICILALKKEMRIKDLFIEAFKKSKLIYFKKMPIENKLKFVEDLPSILSVSKDGFVTLLPKFFLSECSSWDTKVSHTENQCQTVSAANPDLNSIIAENKITSEKS